MITRVRPAQVAEWFAANPAGTQPLVLDEKRPSVDAWAHVRVLADATRQLTVQNVLGRLPEFAEPTGAAGTLGAGTHTVEAALPAAPGVAGSKASSTLTVTKASSTTKLKLSKTKIKRTKQATATITVKAAGVPSGYAPTGTVTVYDGSKKLKSVSLTAAGKGVVKVKLPKLKAKTHTIKVTYAGNADVASSKASKKLKVTK